MARIEDDSALFVPIREASDFRKQLLGAVKKNLVLLKRYEKFRQIRQEKVKRMHELRVLVKELDFLNRKLMKALPNAHLRNASRQKSQPEQRHHAQKAEKRPLTELDKLEMELQGVESKLQSI